MSYIDVVEHKNKIHCWERTKDGELIHTESDVPYYLFMRDNTGTGQYKDIHRNPMRKIHFSDRRELNQFFESRRNITAEGDVQPVYRYIIDNFVQADTSAPYNVCFFDIEVDFNLLDGMGYPTPETPFGEINAFSIYDVSADCYIMIIPSKLKGQVALTDERHGKPVEIIWASSEAEMLLEFSRYLEDIDITSAWNCVPVGENVFTGDRISPIGNLAVGDSMGSYGNVECVFPRSHKKEVKLHLANGAILRSSEDHRFFVRHGDADAYSNLKLGSRQRFRYDDFAVKDFPAGEELFVKLDLSGNKNNDALWITDEELWTLGMVYTDGTIHGRNKDGITPTTFAVSQSDMSILKQFDYMATAIVKTGTQGTGCYSRTIPRRFLPNWEMIVSGGKKALNVEKLSQLSKRQFYIFLSGMLDGDGYKNGKSIELCAYESDVDKNAMYDLLTWNGIFSTITQKYKIRLIDFDPSLFRLRKISRWRDMGWSGPLSRAASSRLKQISYRKIDDSAYWVRIKNVEYTDNVVEMVDIKTTTSYFSMRGTKTHNCDHFDWRYIMERASLIFGETRASTMFTRNGIPAGYREFIDEYGNDTWEWSFPGRPAVDMMKLFKKFHPGEKTSFALDNVCQEELGEGKVDYSGDLGELYRTNPQQFFEYSLHDARLMMMLDAKKKVIDLAMLMVRDMCARVGDIFGSVNIINMALMKFCRLKDNIVLPNMPNMEKKEFIGAIVYDTISGTHKKVFTIDLTALYPSCIILLGMSKENLLFQCIGQYEDYIKIQTKKDVDIEIHCEESGEDISVNAAEFYDLMVAEGWCISANGTVFDGSFGILAEFTKEGFDQRTHYKNLMKSTKDEILINTYDLYQKVMKIRNNSIYGILAQPAFRLADTRIAESTTRTGQIISLWQATRAAEEIDNLGEQQ